MRDSVGEESRAFVRERAAGGNGVSMELQRNCGWKELIRVKSGFGISPPVYITGRGLEFQVAADKL